MAWSHFFLFTHEKSWTLADLGSASGFAVVFAGFMWFLLGFLWFGVGLLWFGMVLHGAIFMCAPH